MGDFTEERLGHFSLNNRERILSIQENFPIIALGVFLCPNARWCLEEMDQFAYSEPRVKEFPWTNNSNTTARPSEPLVVRPPDADHPLWRIPRMPPPEKCTPLDSLNIGDIGAAFSHGPPGTMHLIQRAWVNAVRYDTTFIVFDCGNFARIGIRQREPKHLFCRH
ncbi:hypothetical protein CPB85DRAFT_903548 [Mucidula mucida]|nr:hypothetical protein CPB85DRAFT_903548 [Mucidula mucida]